MTANLVMLPFVLVVIVGTILHGNGVIGKTAFLIAAIAALCVSFALHKVHHARRVRSLRKLEGEISRLKEETSSIDAERSKIEKQISTLDAERSKIEAATSAIAYWRSRAEGSP